MFNCQKMFFVVFVIVFGLFGVVYVVDGVDLVVVKVGDQEIYQLDIDFGVVNFDLQFVQLFDDQKKLVVFLVVIDVKVIVKVVQIDGIENFDEFKKCLVFLCECELYNVYFCKYVVNIVIDDEIKVCYDVEIKKILLQEEIYVCYIFVKIEDEVKVIIKDFDVGKDFVEFVKVKFFDLNKLEGGDFGYFGKGCMVKEFEDVVFVLKKGEYIKILVKMQFGFYVIKVEDICMVLLSVFDQVKDQICQFVMCDKYFVLFVKVKEGIKVEVFDENLKKGYEEISKEQVQLQQ